MTEAGFMLSLDSCRSSGRALLTSCTTAPTAEVGIPAVLRACSTGCGSSPRSEEHTSELQSPYVISYAVFCLKKKQHTHATPSPRFFLRLRRPPGTSTLT